MKSLSVLGPFVCVLTVLTAACFEDDVPVGSGNPDSGTGTACTTNADCASNEECGFAAADTCSAKGQCFVVEGAECEAYSPGCACDGTEINIACNGLPSGYETSPLAHDGACSADGGGGKVDGGSGGGDAGAPCASNADCNANEECGFKASEACEAKGECFAVAGAECLAYSPGCACDGTEINIACNGLPDGYETAPLAHDGTCSQDGGGGAADAGAPCSTSSDCGANEICGFASAEACSATGECFAMSGAICNSFLPGCACDGSEINIACNGLPTGYETAPLAHDGACDDGGVAGSGSGA